MRRGHRYVKRHGGPVCGASHRPDHHLHDHQSPRCRRLGHVYRYGGKPRDRPKDPGRHPSERYAEGIRGPENIHVSARAVCSHCDGHGGIRDPPGAPVEHHQHQRLPHSGSRIHGRAGTGLYPGRRHRLHGKSPGTGFACGRVCTAILLLLQLPPGFF